MRTGLINKNAFHWLCGNDNPPVKYLTLKNLLDTPESRLKKERPKLNSYSVIKEILKHQKTFWGEDKHLYRKYKGGYWNLIFLGDLYANGDDPIIRRGLEFILADDLWHRRIDQCSTQWICLSSNISRAMANLGYAVDPRVRLHIENIASAILKNNGIICSVMDYSLLPQCYMALPKLLMALGSYAGKKPVVRMAIEIAAERLLERNLYRYVPESQQGWNENYDRLAAEIKGAKTTGEGKRTLKEELARVRPQYLKRNKNFKPKAGWLKFGYPLHYNSDILEAMRSMVDAGIKYDKRMDDALDVIEKNRLPDGRWKLGFSLNGKMWIDIEKRGQPSKWITYHAMRVLRHYRELKRGK